MRCFPHFTQTSANLLVTDGNRAAETPYSSLVLRQMPYRVLISVSSSPDSHSVRVRHNVFHAAIRHLSSAEKSLAMAKSGMQHAFTVQNRWFRLLFLYSLRTSIFQNIHDNSSVFQGVQNDTWAVFPFLLVPGKNANGKPRRDGIILHGDLPPTNGIAPVEAMGGSTAPESKLQIQKNTGNDPKAIARTVYRLLR